MPVRTFKVRAILTLLYEKTMFRSTQLLTPEKKQFEQRKINSPSQSCIHNYYDIIKW